jgi:hypothetical protein
MPRGPFRSGSQPQSCHSAPGGEGVAWLLFTAALIQTADVIIALEKKERGMIIGASLAAIVHVLCGLAIT